MNWLSGEHKKIYGQAAEALVNDVKSLSYSVWSGTSTVVANGYNRVRDAIDTIDKNYHEINSSEESDSSEELEDLGYDDIIIHIKRGIRKIVISEGGEERVVTGKITAYPKIHNIITTWFEYKSENGKWRWYPTTELYTEFRKASAELHPMDIIVFRHTGKTYHPYPKTI